MKFLRIVGKAMAVCSVGVFLMVVLAVVISTITESVKPNWGMLLALLLVSMGAVVIFYVAIDLLLTKGTKGE